MACRVVPALVANSIEPVLSLVGGAALRNSASTCRLPVEGVRTIPVPFSEESLATASGDARARKSAHMRDKSTMASTKSSATLEGIGSLSLFIRP